MDYNTLTGGKGTAGSIMNWVSYSKLDVTTVVDEAQSLLFQMLRCREMRTEWTFGMAVGQANQTLPDRFLDPIGRIMDVTNQTDYGQKIETDIFRCRNYDTSPAGSFAADPFTTVLGSSLVAVHEVAHGLNQDSTITVAGATDTGGIAMNGAFAIISITDVDHFVMDVVNEATSAATGGGASATWAANNLIAASPSRWAVWDGAVKFDTAFDQAATLKLLYFRRPKPLSATNLTNFVTSRYPLLMRKACQAASADYMKDDIEYNKQVKALSDLIGATAQENDLIYRGAEFGTDTPGGH